MIYFADEYPVLAKNTEVLNGLELNINDRHGLLKNIKAQLKINWQGIHGIAHWSRVKYHGRKIGIARGADLLVLELFAFLHDSKRENDGYDPGHGLRAARYTKSLNGRYFNLTNSQLAQLCEAMENHTNGYKHDDVTIQSCWDSDRLDLGRVDIKPSPDYLSEEASAYITQAYAWSRKLG
jgi:uncharacterized protein